jgi:hypothetical protein
MARMGMEPIDRTYLQRHWGSAYVISVGRATRKDNRRVLRARNAGELLDLIRLDYQAEPVPRVAKAPRAARAPRPLAVVPRTPAVVR